MFGHQIRMLGRPFSRSVATGLPGIDFTADSRRHSLRVRTACYFSIEAKFTLLIKILSSGINISSIGSVEAEIGSHLAVEF